MSILYCAIPHFAVALARRDHTALPDCPLVLLGPEGRVFDASAEATACGVVAGLTARTAQVRCPEARLLEADVVRSREAFETLLQVLERFSPSIEPHGWGGAYVDLGDLARDRDDAVDLCVESGRAVRDALGDAMQPALGWDMNKFTAQAAARRTRPGRLLAVDAAREHDFLGPLPVALLPLGQDALQRLTFLGLRTLGQYAALPVTAVWQQFGRPGQRAHQCARGEDDRPIIPRHTAPSLAADCAFEVPAVERARLLSAARNLVVPLLAELEGNLQACGQVRLTVHFDDGSAEERTRTFLIPTVDEALIARATDDLLDKLRWPAGATAISISLEQIQDIVVEQLRLFPLENDAEPKLRRVQRYLTARFGASRLWRAALVRPGAPLPEWRASWQGEAS